MCKDRDAEHIRCFLCTLDDLRISRCKKRNRRCMQNKYTLVGVNRRFAGHCSMEWKIKDYRDIHSFENRKEFLLAAPVSVFNSHSSPISELTITRFEVGPSYSYFYTGELASSFFVIVVLILHYILGIKEVTSLAAAFKCNPAIPGI
jgi:hypothetical protein